MPAVDSPFVRMTIGVIHKVSTLGGGKGGPAISVLARIGGDGRFSCRRTYAVIFFVGSCGLKAFMHVQGGRGLKL